MDIGVRVEKLELKPTTTEGTWDAAVQFAIDGRSWPLRLSYDVEFISAFPCARGPHVLFFDYVFERVGVQEILSIKHWGEDQSVKTMSSTGKAERDEEHEYEKVLVVEAFGVPDNEVLARAWCSHWGLSAVVADVERTWYLPFPFLCFTFCVLELTFLCF